MAHPMFPSAHGGAFMPPMMDEAAVRRHEGMQRARMLQKDLDEARIRAVTREIGRFSLSPLSVPFIVNDGRRL